MKGKVNCTCGWSWNKSDSSVKDMYICHECGRDNSNNMKNGGWLDNYNDSKVSLPPGFVGEGTFNGPQWESPAWGGQFQEGGEIPMAQDGRATRADSLDVYNNAKKVEKYYKDKKYKLIGSNRSPGKELFERNDFAAKEFKRDTYTIVPTKDGKNTYIPYPYNKYRQEIDKNKYLQRDNANTILDTRSPIQLFDKRINPQLSEDYINTKRKDPLLNDAVSLSKYDPIAVKPFDLLTDAEKKLRVEKYGTSGVPKSYLNKKPQQQVIVKDENAPQYKTIQTGEGEGRFELIQRPKVEQVIINPQSKGLVQGDTNIKADVSGLRPEVKRAKYFDVRDVVNQNFGGSDTSYKYYPENGPLQELAPEPYNTRTITPRYQMGGDVYPVNYVPQAQGGMSMPGATGNMYARYEQGGDVDYSYPRTKGIPSNGPYAKKTLPSAQNGQEMKFYQQGLDFMPKTISKNGGWLDGYDKAQEGDTIKYGTPEYAKAWKEGDVQMPNANGEDVPYWGGQIDEVVMQNNYKRPRGFWEQYKDKIVEENKDAGVLGAIIGTPISAITSLPQLAATYALTDKMQRPSEAMDIENPYGKFAVDAVADPANWIGVGELTAAGRLTKAEALAKLKNIPTSIAPELRQGLQTAGSSFNSSELFDLNNVRKPSGSIGNQGATSEGANNILQSLGIKVKGANPNEVTLKEMVEHLKNNPKDAAAYKKFLEKEPINVSELPDGSYQINDGHHRATLSYYSGNENIPTIIKNKGEYIKKKNGGIIKDDRGQWNHPGEITEIGSNQITMQGVPYPVLGISDTGDTQMMYPEEEYEFDGEKVTEYPMAKNGLRQEQKGLVNLDNLLNFTNYNKPQPGGWLSKYE